jgi:hypothetical protein
MHVTIAFFYIIFRVPSIGEPSPGSIQRAPIERDATFSELPINYLSDFPVNGLPRYPIGPLWKEVPVPRALARPGR